MFATTLRHFSILLLGLATGACAGDGLAETGSELSTVDPGDDPGDPLPWDDEIDPGWPSPYVNDYFTIQGVKKCVDFGGDAWHYAGAPVFIYSCNGTSAQRVNVVEVPDGTRDVTLRTRTGYCIGVRGGYVTPGAPLELQSCTGSPRQRFALDGDTILVGTQASGRVTRDYVIEARRGRGVDRTPLEVGARDIDAAEYFVFRPLGAKLYPHSGFVRVNDYPQLQNALDYARWGTVIDLYAYASIRLPDNRTRALRAGVTLRGTRRGTNDGPLIYIEYNDAVDWKSMFELNPEIDGRHARITGLRLRGPWTSSSKVRVAGYNYATSPPTPIYQPVKRLTGIVALEDYPTWIDHNEISGFSMAAIGVWGTGAPTERPASVQCGPAPSSSSRVRVLANYIHDNAMEGFGLGVTNGVGTNTWISGNTFEWNRHAVAAGYQATANYSAVHNLVLEGAHQYGWIWPFDYHENDFDVHGSEDGSHHEGGIAGGYFTMAFNTFVKTGGWSIRVRGVPCRGASIYSNVFKDSQGNDVIELLDASGESTSSLPNVSLLNNQYGRSDLMGGAVQGDFDGDGQLDDFLATGGAWYYRPGRTKEWRYLNRHSERQGQLSFGDFDGDGRTDVRVSRPLYVEYSWAGSSPWDR